MAAPAEVTIDNLNGTFVMVITIFLIEALQAKALTLSKDKDLSKYSTDVEQLFVLQGVSWLTRTALSYATVTLHIKEYTGAPPEEGDADKQVRRIDVDQTVTGGIKGTTERRVLDWKGRAHSDHVFGNVVGQSRFVRGSASEGGKVRPALEVQTEIKDEKIARFLRGEILGDGTEVEGFLVEDPKDLDAVSVGNAAAEGQGLWLQNFVRNQDSGWTAEQVCLIFLQWKRS